MYASPSKSQRGKPESIREMFDDIAPTYDLLNHLLSFGLDIRWRRRAVRMLAEKRSGRFLDIAAGSGDLSIAAFAIRPRQVVSTDFSQRMLAVFRRKLQGRDEMRHEIDLVCCDALHLPFPEGSFDATMVAFGIRNFADRLRSLREMYRVLRPGGLSLILELSVPLHPVARGFYRLHTRWILPTIGKLISKHRSAYHYLPHSIAQFPDQKEFIELMNRAGFRQSQGLPLSFGVATAYIGRKQS